MSLAMPQRPPPQRPIVFDATPEGLIEEAKNVVDCSLRVWDHVVANYQPVTATFENCILPIIRDENVKLAKSRVIKFYASTSPSQELRDASNAAQTILNNGDVELYSQARMFELVCAVSEKINDATHSKLAPESKYYVAKLLQRLRLAGCAVTDLTQKSTLENTQRQIMELVKQCTTNLHEDQSGIWLTREELEGVPTSALDVMLKGTGQHHGLYWLKTKPPHPNGVMKHATSEGSRRKVYYAIKNRLPDNVDLIRKLVVARDTAARILGYKNHFALRTADKMVRTPERVTEFLGDIRKKLQPRARAEAAELLDLKVQEIASRGEEVNGVKISLWDEPYFCRARSERSGFKQSDRLSEYFELHHTIARLLEMFGEMFDTRFKHVTREEQLELGQGKPLVWHEDVDMYTVWDQRAESRFLGFAYFDLHPREGKYGHRGCYALQWGFMQSDATRFYPSSAFVMNFAKPSNGQPTLLSLTQVRTLFHELGHLHHHLCTVVEHASMSYVDRDFVEAPSLMFEQFLWQAEQIQNISQHYSYLSPRFRDQWLASNPSNSDGERPPPKLSQQDAAELATQNPKDIIGREVTNLFFSLYDLLVHSPRSPNDLASLNLTEAFNKLQVEITGFHGGEIEDSWEWSHGEAVFRMIVSGYDAGYYSYILGKMFALDMWSHSFAADPTNREAGRRFRSMVLQPGGSQPEMKTLTQYLGRSPKPDAYLQWLGV